VVGDNNRSRVVIIAHPAFLGGKEGIEEAKNFGELILQVIKSKEMFSQVPKHHRKELKKHLEQFKILIRKVPNDVLAK